MAALANGVSLRWIITLGIMLITLLLSATLITRAYKDQHDVLLAATEASAKQLADNLDSASLRLLVPVQNTIQLLQHDPLVQTAGLEQRLQRLPALMEVISANPVVSAVYVGFDDRDFLLVRSLHKALARERVQAPAEARWMVQSIDHQQSGAVEKDWLFYDERMQLLERRAMPDYEFDPTRRPWYRQASQTHTPVLTSPYVFFTTQEVGVTLSLAAADRAVIGIDASVEDISKQLQLLQPGPEYRLAVLNSAGTLVAWPQVEDMIIEQDKGVRLASLDEMNTSELVRLQTVAKTGRGMIRYTADGREWFGMRLPLLAIQGESLELFMSVPVGTLLAHLRDQGKRQVVWSLVVTLFVLVIGWWLAYRLTQPLDRLSSWVQALARFDFRHERIAPSGVREVNELNRVLGSMSSTIRHFQAISNTLARERQLDLMLPSVADHLKACVHASESAIYLYDSDEKLLRLASLHQDEKAERLPQSIECPESGSRQQCDAVNRSLPEGEGTWMVTPLRGREVHPSGVMVLRVAEESHDDAETRLAGFIEELSGSAATAIEMRQLIGAQERLLDAIIRLLADAIDAKSSHTGGHCERVPELAQLMVDEACRSKEGEFSGFTMSQAERYEFRLAAWLHDCGKITTPEYVLDKGTKLETLYNRIHEIRTRFEVLWRDAEIRYLNGVLQQGDEQLLHERLLREQAELQADFEQIARINIGSEALGDDEVAAVRRIGTRTWQRHFDKRLGLSEPESQRLTDEDETLPVTECLLEDKPEHQMPWNGRRPPVEAGDPDNVWGFDMPLPEHERNLGELYNLTQRYGTLTPEERFSINNHIVQTIRMLSCLPFPPSLRRIPEIAGNHHERIDGQGYPRKLKAGELSIPERIMAVADVFEALTAVDRPYKKPKTLSESMRILAFMARDGHLDLQVFGLFLKSGVYQRYAERYLLPEQIDAVDPRQLWLLASSSDQPVREEG